MIQTSKTSFKCDQCDQHIAKGHQLIPQIDGIYDINSNIEKFSQTEEINNKKVEVQTESITDSLALVLIGEIAENWEDEYLGETFWNLPEGFYYDSWYTDSVRRAPPNC